MKHWYVVSTQSRSEEKAAFHLRRQGFEVYLPRYLKRRSHARRIHWLPAPMFPGYLFINLDTKQDQWRPVRSTVGVTHLIGNGETPTSIPDGVVDDIRAREDERGLVRLNIEARFKKGDKVQVVHGTMVDHAGIFDCTDDKGRVFILLDLLGRAVRVRLPMEAVSASV